MDQRPVLSFGSQGPPVRELQELLLRRGFDPGPVDAWFGRMTEAAVRGFQRSKELGADGVVGPLTWAALLADAPLGLGDAGLLLLKTFEGFSPALYEDPAGHCTIGYGHLVHYGQCDGTEPEDFRGGITEERATELLLADARSAADVVQEAVAVPLNQSQFDALVSFTFNVGGGSFRSSTLLKKLNQNEYDAVPHQLNRWVYAGEEIIAGLVRRRKAEGTLFRDGEVEIDQRGGPDARRTPTPTVPPDGF